MLVFVSLAIGIGLLWWRGKYFDSNLLRKIEFDDVRILTRSYGQVSVLTIRGLLGDNVRLESGKLILSVKYIGRDAGVETELTGLRRKPCRVPE